MSHKLTEEEKEKQRRADLDQRALAIWEKALGPEHSELSTFLENYAVLLRDIGRPEEDEALKLVRKRSGEDSDRVWVKN